MEGLTQNTRYFHQLEHGAVNAVLINEAEADIAIRRDGSYVPQQQKNGQILHAPGDLHISTTS